MQPHIYIVHDSFTQLGGAERVVGALLDMFPEAKLFALVADKKILEAVTNRECTTSYLQDLFLAGLPFKYLLPLLPPAVGSFEFQKNSLIISSSSLFLKGIRIPEGSRHIEYMHTPPRFIWSTPEYVDQEVNFFIRPFVKIYLSMLKKWDFAQAQKKNLTLIANSKEVQERIKKFYGIDSQVIYPFIDLEFWKPVSTKQDFFLMGGRLQQHKNYSNVIEAFKGSDYKLKIFGTGRAELELKNQAAGNANIEFLGRISDDQLKDLYSSAKCFIYPSYEDFGIMPLEASACGTPVIALRGGGSLETIEEGINGLFFDEPTPASIKIQLDKLSVTEFNPEKIKQVASKFSKQNFENQIHKVVDPFLN